MIVLLAVSGAAGEGGPYPEERRFDTSQFHEGLKRRGLTDLLTLHLLEHPPADPVEAALLARDIKLAEYADPSRTGEEQLAAIAEANRLLEKLIEDHPGHTQVGDWQMELGRSLLYTEADRYTSSILYRGGRAAGREALWRLMGRAVQVISSLYERLTEEYEALDGLSTREYEALEESGAVNRLESDVARSDYMLAWARFYRALAREPGDAGRLAELRLVLDYLQDRSNLLEVPHAETHYQAQALLLAGMSHRLLGDHRACRPLLEEAIDAVSNILDEKEQRGLTWVAALGRMELIRSYRDGGDFQTAQRTLEIFREEARRVALGDLSLQLTVALLERSVYRVEADGEESRGHHEAAAGLRARAIRGLRMLALRGTDYRDDIYAALYEALQGDADPDSLQPFERCALVAGTLGQATTIQEEVAKLRLEGLATVNPAVLIAEQRRVEMLDRAIEVARPMTETGYPMSADLQAEVTFNLGVALHQRGRRFEAARSFLQVARRHPGFFRAVEAGTFAVQLAWEMYQDRTLAARSDVQELYSEAMTTLTETYPDSEPGRYWWFFLGQHLAGAGRYDEAADAYGHVDAAHQRHYEAQYLGAEARARSLQQFAARNAQEVNQIMRRATEAIRAARNAEKALANAAAAERNVVRRGELLHLAARANLLTGELYAVRGVNRWEKALETLEGFETRFEDESALIGRVLRVRMIALEGLGRHEQASNLIPEYIAKDPNGAAVTLQGLFDTLGEEIEQDKKAGRTEQAQERAESAYVIAQGMYDLARNQPGLFGSGVVYALRLQLAEAAIEQQDYEQAKALFEQCYAEDSGRYSNGQPRDSRAIYGTAEAYYRLGRYAEALPLFNRLFASADRGERIRWQALLRDLQCRTELGHDPKVIIKSIRQQKYFDREMGGPDLRRRFDVLLTLNERRAEGR